ncbi:MAG: hypothetical protein LBD68_10570 [Zoogloeaceae bacterium]|nr:hypothetical protein [Zoogloeaceae bacterium]
MNPNGSASLELLFRQRHNQCRQVDSRLRASPCDKNAFIWRINAQQVEPDQTISAGHAKQDRPGVFNLTAQDFHGFRRHGLLQDARRFLAPLHRLHGYLLTFIHPMTTIEQTKAIIDTGTHAGRTESLAGSELARLPPVATVQPVPNSCSVYCDTGADGAVCAAADATEPTAAMIAGHTMIYAFATAKTSKTAPAASSSIIVVLLDVPYWYANCCPSI